MILKVVCQKFKKCMSKCCFIEEPNAKHPSRVLFLLPKSNSTQGGVQLGDLENSY